MDNQQARKNLIAFIKTKVSQISTPVAHDPKCGELSRFFDYASGFNEMLSSGLWDHMQQVKKAQETDTLALWSYNLAAYIQEWLLGPIMSEFSLDIRETLTDHFISQSKQALKNIKVSPKECESSLCRGLESRILQDLFNHNMCSSESITLIKSFLNGLDYTSREDIDAKRINALRDQLKVDLFNEEHGHFWENHTTLGLLRFGGKKVQPNVKDSFKVPDTVYALMKQSDEVLLNYEHYRQNLCYQKELHSQHYHILRKPLTSAFYKEADLEYTNVEALEQKLTPH